MKFEQTFKNIDDILHKDAGCSSELDYVEQTSWILFLKYLDDLEKDLGTAAELTGKTHTSIIDKDYQWTVWAMPRGKDGKLDHHIALTGDDLTDFVNNKLFPYLKKFKTNPLNESDLAEFVTSASSVTKNGFGPETENSWYVEVKSIDQSTFNLSVKNPNKKEEVQLRSPHEIL